MTASHFISNSVCPLCCFYFENRGHLHSVCYPHLRSPPPHLTPSSLNYHGARDQPVASLFSHVTPGRAPHFADGAPLMWMRVLIGLHTSPLTNMKKQNKQKKRCCHFLHSSASSVSFSCRSRSRLISFSSCLYFRSMKRF